MSEQKQGSHNHLTKATRREKIISVYGLIDRRLTGHYSNEIIVIEITKSYQYSEVVYLKDLQLELYP
jgi:hypothetical protein